ncbi:MAG: CPXCG motif-containing cysteine-rich protein [candidate division Zixibacteria bacterium]|nr:CPXCG motif-containing cysteine-rich protein [candidate division Zixibacteria bacterium]
MEHYIECAACGEEIDLSIDFEDGDDQEIRQQCEACGALNIVRASFDYAGGDFELECHCEAVG